MSFLSGSNFFHPRTLDESLAQQTIIWGRDNLFKGFTIEKGAPIGSPEAWAEAEVIVEGDYATGAQEQLYIEPNGMIARASAAGGARSPDALSA